MTDPWVQDQINSEGSPRKGDGETAARTAPRSGRNNSPATASDIAAGSHEPALPTPPAEAAPAKAGDREAAEDWSAFLVECSNPAESIKNMPPFEIVNLAKCYIAEREASAALRREVERLNNHIQLHAGDTLSLSNDVEAMKGHWEAAELREGELREALEKVAAAKYEDRPTVTQETAWYHFKRLNDRFVDLCDLARKALGATP